MSIKTEIWDSVTGDISETEQDHSKYESERLKKMTTLYENAYHQFALSLPENQRKAFMSIIEIQANIECEVLYKGMAMGIDIAKNLYSILNHPADALNEASEHYTPVTSVLGNEIECINDYLKSVNMKEIKSSYLLF